MYRTLAVVAVVAVVGLAGCSGAFGAGGDGSSDEPTTETVELSSVDYPEYTGPDGVENASAFAGAMSRQLADEGYSATYTSEARDGMSMNIQVEHDPDTSEVYVQQTLVTGQENLSDRYGETYVDGRTGYFYDNLSDPQASGLHNYSLNPITGLGYFNLEDVDLEASHGIERGDETLIVYDVTAYHYGDETTLTNVSGQAVIDERGVLREHAFSFPEPTAGNIERVEYTVSTETPTIEEPEWVADVDASEMETARPPGTSNHTVTSTPTGTPG